MEILMPEQMRQRASEYPEIIKPVGAAGIMLQTNYDAKQDVYSEYDLLAGEEYSNPFHLNC